MHLQNPVVLLPFGIQPIHGQVVALGDVKRRQVLGDPLVREVPHQVPRVRPAKLVAGLARLGLHQRVQLPARHVRPGAVRRPARLPRGRQRIPQPALGRVRVGQHKRPPKVGLPRLEHGAEVDEEDVVGRDGAVRGGLLVREQGVRPAAHDALVPVRLDVVAPGGELVDLLAELGLGGARPDEVALDLVEEGDGFVLGVEQGVCSLLLRERGGFGRHGVRMVYKSFLSLFC